MYQGLTGGNTLNNKVERTKKVGEQLDQICEKRGGRETLGRRRIRLDTIRPMGSS